MEVFSVTEFQERWDELIERVENGETLGIVNDNGDSAVMMPADDPVYRMYKDHDEAS
jgi:PHD/YefM family antitoxin component YafN of YafNO toxin-antitoxin module